MANFRVVPVPMLQDNYAYLVIEEGTNKAAVVDPVEPDKVIDAAKKEGANLECILTTHHHWDHAGGNENMKKLMSSLKVYGGDDRVGALTNTVKEGDVIKIGNVTVNVYSTPCHTSGHVLYHIPKSADEGALFTGDTLFVAGCGRFFEGKPEQMHKNLNHTIASLPKNTQVWVGHEYTAKNLEFAKAVEPNNADIQKKTEWVKQQRSKGLPTVPSTIEDELKTNPFMRVSVKEVMERVKETDPVAVMGALRSWKDSF